MASDQNDKKLDFHGMGSSVMRFTLRYIFLKCKHILKGDFFDKKGNRFNIGIVMGKLFDEKKSYHKIVPTTIRVVAHELKSWDPPIVIALDLSKPTVWILDSDDINHFLERNPKEGDFSFCSKEIDSNYENS